MLSLRFLSPLRKYNPKSLFKRSMADHLDRTHENTRNEVICLATVVGMRDESRTVKSLTLKVERGDLTFKAGQWVDMFIPGVSTVGGFSMYSSPCKLQTTRQMDLAVKFSNHPPAYWVHNQCKEGSQVHVRVGGDFFYDPITSEGHDLLLIAGGVGINPLLSIFNHVADQCKGDNPNSDHIKKSRVMLLYSAKTEEELIFKEHIKQSTVDHENIMCGFYSTREQAQDVKTHRIGPEDIAECFDWLRKDQTVAYLCGPSPMLTDMENILTAAGVQPDCVKYEKWW
ncbi:oxidoreductase NAD-binding domain-containing protein 1-like [Mya arenaria]|uniref:oxidoreductase NAD-binding domain-containing protein 1-like n=1 Tax=Mya arenaria TaxID=6604 RepID=UPI0022E540AE|nr:oxidoreductase NAD-binding domain-containing protein 1-like [Mya arenaria]